MKIRQSNNIMQIKNNDEQVAAASLLELLCSGSTHTCVHNDLVDADASDSSESKSSDSSDSPVLEDHPVLEQSFGKFLNTSSCMGRRYSDPDTFNKEVTSLPEKKTTRSRTKRVPEVLMELLTNNQNTDFLCFLPDDKNFIITNTKRFTEQIMPKYFKISKFGCFLNRLTKFGFTHAALDDDKHLFFHPLFHKCDWVSLQHIEYRPMKSESGKANTSTDLTRKRKFDYDNDEVQSSPVSKVLRIEETSLDLIPSFCSRNQEGFSTGLFNNLDFSSRSMDQLCSLSSCSTSSFFEDSRLVSTIMSASEIALSPGHFMQAATMDVVTKAVNCLLYDRDHTIDLLARRGSHVYSSRLSLPFSHNL